jgi:hypothetical protein
MAIKVLGVTGNKVLPDDEGHNQDPRVSGKLNFSRRERAKTRFEVVCIDQF